MVMNYNPTSGYKSYSTNCRMSIYVHPEINISNTGKIDNSILTPESDNVLVVNNDSFELDFNINNFNSNTKTYRYEILKFNNLTKTFNQKVYVSENFSTPTFGQKHYVDNLFLDGDYIIKNYFTYKDNKLFKNVIFNNGNGDTTMNNESAKLGIYNETEDNYIILIKNPSKPILFSQHEVYSESDVIESVTLKPNGSDEIEVNNNIKGEIIVTFNGLILANKLDYVFKNNLLKFREKTKKKDIINVFYTNKGKTLSVEVFNIKNILKTKNVTYNKEKNKFELYIERGLSGKKEVISLNGLVLTPNKDYVRSNTVNNKIILMGELKNGDIINVVYTPIISLVGDIASKSPALGWYIPVPPNNDNGNFILEISKFYDFREINFNKIIKFDVNKSVYKTELDFNLESFTNYHYRVISEKIHTTINGSKIKLKNISEQYQFKLTNKQINSY